MHQAWRATSVVGLLAVVGLGTALPAGAAGKGRVGPKQYFTGVINGTDGNTTTPIVIRMNCTSPASSGETGHPMAGQTLAVHQAFPPTPVSSGLGYTGNDSQIGFFLVPPPSATTPQPASHAVVFKRYDKTQALPTSLTLPCSGGGNFFFVPTPVVPPSQSQTVPVDFVTLVP
jgi:hypothetical protein